MDRDSCDSPHCGCHLTRRDALRVLSLSAGAAVARGSRACMAGPFTRQDFESLVPADKKLDAAWVRSLTARGEPEVYRGADLETIGMPIGGIGAGQLYLGGDGHLWHWDIFNQPIRTGAEHYAKPLAARSTLQQGFALRVTTHGTVDTRPLRAGGFAEIAFRGEYPLGFVEYRDPTLPVSVTLEAFSPFLPLEAEDSALPATVLRFTLKNTGREKVDTELVGWLENAIGLYSGAPSEGLRRNRLQRRGELTLIEYAGQAVAQPVTEPRPDILFEDFEKPGYEGWTVQGTAFGDGPAARRAIPKYQGDLGGEGQRVVNSHASAPGKSVTDRDNATGRLTSREFTIQRHSIGFYLGGGNHAGKTCLNVLVDGKVVRTAVGENKNQMRRMSLDVRAFEGRTARIEIVDDRQGGWGNIGVDHIVFTDSTALLPPLEKRADFGSMSLAVLDPQAAALLALPAGDPAEQAMMAAAGEGVEATAPLGQDLVGALKCRRTLEPGKSETVTFLLTWHFPNHRLQPVQSSEGRRYAARFANATAVAEYVASHFERLAGTTRLWHDTWYDSSLPHWFLNRTFLNTSILASSTCHWFQDGRFYGWEGVGCCAGTCTHVWHYAHAVGRLFPQLERDLRERTDYGLAFQPDTGIVKFRGEGAGLAVDGQAGVILRTLREHQMSADGEFLKRNWPKIRKALECLIERDANGDGVLEGAQHNTLDADWFGPVAWLSGLYLAALRAGEEMARETGDAAFVEQCRTIYERGAKNLVERLWGDEYFINRPDPEHAQAINSGTGCEIDQVFGQSWAWQVGLGRVLPKDKTLQSLRALWRYNFTPDVGPYREAMRSGRWYAMPGEAGLLMCTFPRTDWDFEKACGVGNTKPGFAGYFNECMNGFEYQVAGHMLWEGMIQEGLAITRAVHDRYHASRRNPWNEVECGDHYARSMASYGVYLAACGYEYHGPKGHLGFAPRVDRKSVV